MIKLVAYPHRPPESRWCLEIDLSANGFPPETKFFATAEEALDYTKEYLCTPVDTPLEPA